jgi:hypothetical protein
MSRPHSLPSLNGCVSVRKPCQVPHSMPFWPTSIGMVETASAGTATVRRVSVIAQPSSACRWAAQAYRRLARKAGKIWREHGALEFRECVAESELLFTLVRISSTNQLSLALICMQISHGHSCGDAH